MPTLSQRNFFNLKLSKCENNVDYAKCNKMLPQRKLSLTLLELYWQSGSLFRFIWSRTVSFVLNSYWFDNYTDSNPDSSHITTFLSLISKFFIHRISQEEVFFLEIKILMLMHPGGSESWGWGLHPGGGVCIQGGWTALPHPRYTWNTTGYGKQAGGTHPTGMHSCLLFFLIFFFAIVINSMKNIKCMI